MNTGISYMTEASLQRLNSLGEVLYEENFSILNSFGTYSEITKSDFSLFTQEEAQERYTSFISWISSKILSGKQLDSGQYIDLNAKECPLPNLDWEILPSLEINSTLKVDGTGTGILETIFDKVGVSKEEDYFVEFFLIEEGGLQSVDFLEINTGELVYKSGVERNQLVFDINKEGELIVISEDADHYFINEMGELCYKY